MRNKTYHERLMYPQHLFDIFQSLGQPVKPFVRLLKRFPREKVLNIRLPKRRDPVNRELKQQTFLIHGRLPEVKFQASHLLPMPCRF